MQFLSSSQLARFSSFGSFYLDAHPLCVLLSQARPANPDPGDLSDEAPPIGSLCMYVCVFVCVCLVQILLKTADDEPSVSAPSQFWFLFF